MGTIIINSWDAGDEELLNDIEKGCKERSKRRPEGAYFWDLPNKRVVFYVNSQRYVIPFPPELDINDSTVKELHQQLFQQLKRGKHEQRPV